MSGAMRNAVLTAAGFALAAWTSMAAAKDVVANDADLETRLHHFVGALFDGRADADEAMRLSESYPRHNLVQLMVGDWMMARAHGRVLFEHPGALSRLRIAGLRDEATQRLSYHPPPSGYRPTAILNLSSAHRHVLMVDASRSRVYVFENRDGEPHLIANYYASIGKKGMDKRQRGDNRSPTGVYRVVKWLGGDTLDELYGIGAYTLDYPNNWDKLNARTGSGIWLHGTPSTLDNRPPLASRGCVVLNNEILEGLRGRIGMPSAVVLVARSHWLPAEDWRLARKALLARIERWRGDWESLDTGRYFSHYADEYRDDKRDYAAMVANFKRNAGVKRWVRVGVSRVDLFAYPGEERQVLAVFDQDYRSNNYKTRYRKQQMWREDDGELKLIYEGRWGG